MQGRTETGLIHLAENSAVYAVALCVFVRLSVCHKSEFYQKRQIVGRQNQRHTIAHDYSFRARRNARIASAVLDIAIPSVCLSVRLSVRLSVTRRYCIKTTARSTVQFALSHSKMCLVL